MQLSGCMQTYARIRQRVIAFDQEKLRDSERVIGRAAAETSAVQSQLSTWEKSLGVTYSSHMIPSFPSLRVSTITLRRVACFFVGKRERERDEAFPFFCLEAHVSLNTRTELLDTHHYLILICFCVCL